VDGCPFSILPAEALTGDERSAIDATATTAVSGEGAETAAWSWACPALASAIVQRFAQQGIAACIAASLLPGLATQHAPTDGIAMTKTSRATATAVAYRPVTDDLR
jgi:hypothetical protein